MQQQREQIKKKEETLEDLKKANAHAELELPSGGIIYPKDSCLSKGTVHMRYMRGEDEEVLLSPAYVREDKALPALLQRLILEPDFTVDELTVGDQMFLLLSARVMSIGDDYVIKDFNCNYCGAKDQEVIMKVSDLEERDIKHNPVAKGENEFFLTLPATEYPVTISAVTVAHEKEMMKMEERLQQSTNEEFTVNHRTAVLLKKIPVNKAKPMEAPQFTKDLNESPTFGDKLRFLRQLPVKDTQAIRNFLLEINGIPDNMIDAECPSCGRKRKMPISFGIGFFFP